MNLLRCEHFRPIAAMQPISCSLCGKRPVETKPAAGSEGSRGGKSRRLAAAGTPSSTSDGVTYFIVPFECRLLGITPMTQVELIAGASGKRSLAVFVMEDTNSAPRRALVFRLDTRRVAVVHVYSGL